MPRYIEENRLQETLAKIPMEIRTFRKAVETILEAPTEDVKPVNHGEWLGTEYDGYSDGFPVYTTWKCSNCGAEFECEDMDFHYCPRCGAYMDEGQGENT